MGPKDPAQVTHRGVNYHLDRDQCEGCKIEEKGIWKASTICNTAAVTLISSLAYGSWTLRRVFPGPVAVVFGAATGYLMGRYSVEREDEFEEQQNGCRIHNNKRGDHYLGYGDEENSDKRLKGHLARYKRCAPYEGAAVHPYIAFKDLRLEAAQTDENDLSELQLFKDLKRDYENEQRLFKLKSK